MFVFCRRGEHRWSRWSYKWFGERLRNATHFRVYQFSKRCSKWLHETICNHFEHLQPFPYPLLAFIDSPEILGNPLQYIHSESMDFFDFLQMQGGTWGPAGRALDPPMAPYGFSMAPHGITVVPLGCPEASYGAPTDSRWRCMRRHAHPLCEPRRSLDACCLPARG